MNIFQNFAPKSDFLSGKKNTEVAFPKKKSTMSFPALSVGDISRTEGDQPSMGGATIGTTIKAPVATKKTAPQSYMQKQADSNLQKIKDAVDPTVDRTQSGLYQGLKGFSDRFQANTDAVMNIQKQNTGVFQNEILEKQQRFIQTMLDRGETKEDIFSALQILKDKGDFDYKPGFVDRVSTAIGERRQDWTDQTYRRATEGPTIGSSLASGLQGVGMPFGASGDIFGSAIAPAVQAGIEALPGEGAERTLQSIGEAYGAGREKYPDLFTSAEGIGNFGTSVLGGMAVGGIVKKAPSVARGSAEAIKSVPGAIKKAPGAIDDIVESGVEKLANKALGSSDGTAELFKATSPSYNVLAKSKDISEIKNKARVADDAVVEAGYAPKTTTDRVSAYKATMKKIWGDVEKARGGVLEKYKADSIADTIVSEVEKIKVNGKVPPSLQLDVTALMKEADFYRNLGDVSLPDLGIIRSNINANLSFGDKTQFSDAYNAIMKKVISTIKEGEDIVLTRNAGPATSGMLAKYGALRSLLDDVIKQDIKASRAKGLPIEESFGRIAGLAEMAGGVGQLIVNPKQAIPTMMSGGSKVLLGKVAGKIKDPDYLIRTGYEKLIKSKNTTNGNTPRNTSMVRPNSDNPKTQQAVKSIVKPTQSNIPGSRKTTVETPLNPKGNETKVLAKRQGILVDDKGPIKLLPSGDRMRKQQIKGIEDELALSLRSMYNYNKPQTARSFIEQAIARGNITKQEGAEIAKRLYEKGDGFEKPHYQKLIDDLSSQKKEISFEDLVNEGSTETKQSIIRKTAREEFDDINKNARDGRFNQSTIDEKIRNFKEKYGIDPIDVDYSYFDKNGDILKSVAKKPLSTNPTGTQKGIVALKKGKNSSIVEKDSVLSEGAKKSEKVSENKSILKKEAMELATPEELLNKFTGRDKPEVNLKNLKEISPDGFSLEKVNISDLEHNIRIDDFDNPTDSVKKIKGIIEQYKKDGKIQPIILNKKGAVVDGNHRINAYKALGIKEIQAYFPVLSDIKKLDNLATRLKKQNQSLDSYFSDTNIINSLNQKEPSKGILRKTEQSPIKSQAGFLKIGSDDLVSEAKKYKSAEEFVKSANSSNPTGTIFTDYTPEKRVKIPLGKRVDTLDKLSGGSPDDAITIYRGGGDKINNGDFVTTNKQLAKDYAGNGKVHELKAKKGDIISTIDEWEGEEYIYRKGASTEKRYTDAELRQIYEQAHKPTGIVKKTADKSPGIVRKTIVKRSDDVEVKPVNKLNTGEEITLVRGTGGKGSGAGESIRGKGLYLTDSMDVAKHYGPDIKSVKIKNSDILDGNLTLRNSKEIISTLPKEMRNYLDDSFKYSYNSLIKTIEGNTGIGAEDIAEVINSHIKKKYKGVKFNIGLVNDTLDERGFGSKNAFVIF